MLAIVGILGITTSSPVARIICAARRSGCHLSDLAPIADTTE